MKDKNIFLSNLFNKTQENPRVTKKYVPEPLNMKENKGNIKLLLIIDDQIFLWEITGPSLVI